jgi:hypothetical protein
MMWITGCFSATYAEARGKFNDAARAAGAALGTHPNPAVAPDGLRLSTETARLGPPKAERLLIVMSGTHGVEGFSGSGQQVALLKSGVASELPSGTALLMIHAINPSGFATIRRVTEGNVDLNRNFVDHGRPYPASPGYELLRDAICPRDWSAKGRAAADAILDAYATAHGAMALQTAISGGQFVDPDGLFYGGRGPVWSNRTLHEILMREAFGARHVGFIDLHSGLGPYGVGEINNNHVFGEPGYQRAKDWYGSEVTSSEEGSSASAMLVGTVNTAFVKWLGPEAVTGITLESGTVEVIELREALRADNWLYRYGRPDSAQGRAIAAELRRVFYPDTDDWRSIVWERVVDVIRRALRGVSQS